MASVISSKPILPVHSKVGDTPEYSANTCKYPNRERPGSSSNRNWHHQSITHPAHIWRSSSEGERNVVVLNLHPTLVTLLHLFSIPLPTRHEKSWVFSLSGNFSENEPSPASTGHFCCCAVEQGCLRYRPDCVCAGNDTFLHKNNPSIVFSSSCMCCRMQPTWKEEIRRGN